jgi:cell division protein FtsI/penicillin-binding protein 2
MRLFFLQVITTNDFTARAADQHHGEYQVEADRGEIFLQDAGEIYPVAVNKEFDMVYVSPKEIIEKEFTARELSGALGVPYEDIFIKVSKEGDPFEIIKKKISDDEARNLTDKKLTGVHITPEKYRHYPGETLASQVVGFASLDPDARAPGYGIEAFFDQELSGLPGEVRQEKDAAGRWIPLADRDVVEVEHGDDLVLTLEKTIQHETERILTESISKYGADSASAIVMDPKTGKILAMATAPTFDPNKYREVEDYTIFLNQNVTFEYEPGSIMKPLTMAFGIEEGKVTPDSTYVDPGVVSIAGYDIHNAEDKTYGVSNMYKVLDESINTGVIHVEQLVGNEKYKAYMERIGFGKKSGIDLPAETAGNLANIENTKKQIQFFTSSFGQGITTTPLQMTMAYGALANGGQLMRPQIIEKVIKSNGQEVTVDPQTVRRVFSEKTSVEMAKMLRSVVVNGHGKRADVPGYLVGGKTGTAQVASRESKGYEEGTSIGSFAGYAPLGNPQFVVVVKIDNPKNVEWAESSAAPAFGEIMKFLLEYNRVVPTEDPQSSPLAKLPGGLPSVQKIEAPVPPKENE